MVTQQPASTTSDDLTMHGGADESALLRFQVWTICHRCLILLISLVALLVLFPFLGGHQTDVSFLLEAVVSVVLLSAVLAVSNKRWHVFAAAGLAVPALAGNWSGTQANASTLGLVSDAFEIGFFGLVIALLFRYVLQRGALGGDRLAGALSIYLLLGLAFSMAYALVESLAPGSFATPDGRATWDVLLYYSFVTLTTLGFGEITPTTAAARSLTMLEATTGVLYVAVLVAWLVSSLRPPH